VVVCWGHALVAYLGIEVEEVGCTFVLGKVEKMEIHSWDEEVDVVKVVLG